MRRRGAARVAAVVVLTVLIVLAAGCAGGRSFDSVQELYEAAGGQEWCDGELTETLPPFVGNCGDPTTDQRVVLGVGEGGAELRDSIATARENLVGDGQLLLVPEDPDADRAWQLRSRDRALLEEAQGRIGGVLLDSERAVDEWLGETAEAAARRSPR